MSYSTKDTGWKSILPYAYHWLDFVQIASQKSTEGCRHFIAMVSYSEEGAGSVIIDAPDLDNERKKNLEDLVLQSGWRGKSNSVTVSMDGLHFLLVARPTIRSGPTQLARQFGLDVSKAVLGLEIASLGLYRPSSLATVTVLDGLISGFYDSGLFRNSDRSASFITLKHLERIALFDSTITPIAIDDVKCRSRALILTRALQDAPPNWLTPEMLARISRELASELGIECRVHDTGDIYDKQMEAFLAVASGSIAKPFLITLELPGVDNSKTVALVGKGLTFDTGGISIKPSLAMDEMKYDMSGAASVLGAAYYLSHKKPPVRVVCVIGACENMPSGSAVKPGSIIKAMNGKTIEVLNTDAEGRLVLADLLHFAITEYRPSLVVDVATLTGAVLHALGHVGAAYMSNDDDVANYLERMARSSGELLCRLPLWPEFDKEVKSNFADLANIAKPGVLAGSIMGAVFLKEFVGETPWVHVDIAGTAWSCKGTGFPESGGSAFLVRTLIEVCGNFGKDL